MAQFFKKNTLNSGSLAIFLPLWFYVKSILADFSSKIAILTILGDLSNDFVGILNTFKSEIPKNEKSMPPNS